MIITTAQLEELTGYKRHGDQRRWLDRNGIPYRVRPDGMPVLTWNVFDQALLTRRQRGPNLTAIGGGVS